MDTAPWSRCKSEIYAFLGRNPRSNRMVVDIAGLAPHDVTLDIGCGPRAAVRRAATQVARAIGVDRSEAMIEIARRRSRDLRNVAFHVGGAEALPLEDASIDVAWTIHAFHHWERPDGGIAEAQRVLRPGGRLMIVETETRGAHGLSRASADELADRLLSAGFASAGVAKHKRQLVVTGVATS